MGGVKWASHLHLVDIGMRSIYAVYALGHEGLDWLPTDVETAFLHTCCPEANGIISSSLKDRSDRLTSWGPNICYYPKSFS